MTKHPILCSLVGRLRNHWGNMPVPRRFTFTDRIVRSGSLNSEGRFLLGLACLFVSTQIAIAALPRGQLVSWGSIGISHVAPGAKFSAIGAGLDHNLAVTTAGTVAAWGNGYDGETSIPADLTNVIAVS